MELLNAFPILLVDDELNDDTAAGRATRALVDQLDADGTPVITATELDDAAQIVAATATLSAVVIDWDAHQPLNGARRDAGAGAVSPSRAETLIATLRAGRPTLPIFLLADRSPASGIPINVLGWIDGYVWKLEDTAAFVAGRIEAARREYLTSLLPPFFEALVRFTRPVGEAETDAARIFGAERTWFVSNGTSAANKIVFHSCVRHGDVVLVDRTCHKSIMHAIIITGAIPVYLHPIRNTYGIIGPIPPQELAAEQIAARLRDHPLVPDGTTTARLAVVTNCTHDGLCYDAPAVLDALGDRSERVLFDEAWFAYAHFHPLYAKRHAMGIERRPEQPATFATQSTHRLLTAFSQGSMVHLHDPAGLISPTALQEALMMHTSASPQYGIIASLDVASRMMDGPQGTAMIDGAIEEALAFRRELTAAANACRSDDWCFRAWQPDGATDGTPDQQRDPERWVLRDGQDWHGYAQTEDGHAMLDPLKVTILTPGISTSGHLQEYGIPAGIVSRFLDERGIVVERTGAYSFLALFSLGITRGTAGTLLAELREFKRLYENNAPLSQALPRLVAEHPARYAQLTLRGLADELQAAVHESGMTELMEAMYAHLPEPVLIPAAAYEHIVDGTIEMVAVDELADRVSAAMIVPYPPGIPVIMPGERFPAGVTDDALLRYLGASQALDARFPAFETEIHGVEVQSDGTYLTPCLPAKAVAGIEIRAIQAGPPAPHLVVR